MPTSSGGPSRWQQMLMNLANAALPGSPFNTSQPTWGQAWQAGDWRQFRNDPYARARVLAGMLPGAAGTLGELAVSGVEKYNHRTGAPLPQSQYGPYASGYQLPDQGQQSQQDDQGSYVINQDGSGGWPDYYGMAAPHPQNTMPAYRQSMSTGGGFGYGWQPADMNMTMAALGSGFVNTGSDLAGDRGLKMWLSKAVR